MAVLLIRPFSTSRSFSKAPSPMHRRLALFANAVSKKQEEWWTLERIFQKAVRINYHDDQLRNRAIVFVTPLDFGEVL